MKRNRGISLIEILVSLLIIALIVGPFTGMFIQSTRVRLTIQKQLKGIYVVRNEMEKLMAKNSTEAYDSNGECIIDGFYVHTSVTPYSTNRGAPCFYITVNTLYESDDEILILTPDGYKTIVLQDRGESFPILIDLNGTHFNINIAGQIMTGGFEAPGTPEVYINLINKLSSNVLNFSINGDAEVKVYPGDGEDWSLSHSKEYTIVERCSYRDYSILKIKIEAFDDASLNKSIFKAENIIRVKN